jgi:glutathione S-transferase
MALTLHIGNMNYSSWSMRAGVLLRAFDIDFTENLIICDSFQADSTFKQSVLQLTPTGTVPLLAEDTLKTLQGQPLVVTDTLSIIEFIAERYPHHEIWRCAPWRSIYALKCTAALSRCASTV